VLHEGRQCGIDDRTPRDASLSVAPRRSIRPLDLFAPWLLLAYGLFLLTFLLHRTIGAPWFERMTALSTAADDGPVPSELDAVIHDRWAGLLFWYTIAMIIGFVFIMVVKPLS
jgi:hypothetical protein